MVRWLCVLPILSMTAFAAEPIDQAQVFANERSKRILKEFPNPFDEKGMRVRITKTEVLKNDVRITLLFQNLLDKPNQRYTFCFPEGNTFEPNTFEVADENYSAIRYAAPWSEEAPLFDPDNWPKDVPTPTPLPMLELKPGESITRTVLLRKMHPYSNKVKTLHLAYTRCGASNVVDIDMKKANAKK